MVILIEFIITDIMRFKKIKMSSSIPVSLIGGAHVKILCPYNNRRNLLNEHVQMSMCVSKHLSQDPTLNLTKTYE